MDMDELPGLAVPVGAHELSPALRDTYRRLVDVVARRQGLEAEEAELRETLRQGLPPGGYTVDGKEAVSIRVVCRFDPAIAAQVVPSTIIPSISRIDASAAKAVLPPALYEKCRRESDKRTVTLK